jgi:hypothetical protein
VRGKFSYLAPEQLEHPGERVDRRVDLWALGIVSWEMFAAKRLFTGHADADKLHRILHMPIPKVCEVAPDVPQSVASIIDACLSRDPDARPRDAATIAAGIRAALGTAQLSYRGELAAYMESRFGEVRRKTEEQLNSLRTPESLTMPTVNEPKHRREPAPTPVPQKSRAPTAIAIGSVALLGVAAIVYATYVNGAPAQRRERVQAEPRVNAPAPPAPHAESRAPRHITVTIGSGVRRVLVDGSQRDDRPLRLEIPDDRRVHLELIGRNGRTVTHDLGAQDDGASFDIARAPRPTKRRSSGLMESPY